MEGKPAQEMVTTVRVHLQFLPHFLSHWFMLHFLSKFLRLS